MPNKNPAAVALGRLGGMKTKASMPKDHYKNMGKNSAKSRAKKRLSTDTIATSAS